MSSLNALLDRGPLPGRMDVWLEDAHYFHSFHEQMIGEIASSLREPLRELGYIIARETSLQLSHRLIPDALIRTRTRTAIGFHVDYPHAASELAAEAGILQDETPELTNVAIYQRDSMALVTIIEVVSPGNKNSDEEILKYVARRESLIYGQQVNVIEIDITRSYKRLTRPSDQQSPYHVAIHIPGHGLRVVHMSLDETFKRIAIPLTGPVIALDLALLYEQTYRSLGLADLMFNEGFYTFANLPFPTLLTDAERDEALATVAVWQAAIEQARQNPQ